MAYTPTVWKNGEFPPIDAEHLNKIEQGIADAVSVTPQTLTNEQKAQARGNIGAGPDSAVLYTPQALTNEQKAQARTNIGADTVQGAVLYTPQTLSDAQKEQAQANIGVTFPCNPNLLDNCYFGNPVNQRGQTEYTSPGYSIDRWWFDNDSNAVTITLTNEGIKFSAAAGAAGVSSISQIIPPEVRTALAGKTVTLSAYGKADTTQQVLFLVNGQVVGASSSAPINGVCLTTTTYTFPDVLTSASVFIYGRSTPGIGEGTILAAKLELGDRQTLAHKDASGNWLLNEIPDYGEQLRRCQRYFYKVFYIQYQTIGMAYESSKYAILMLPLPVEMRLKNPTLTQSVPIELGSSEKILTDAEVSGCMACLNVHYDTMTNPIGSCHAYCQSAEGVTFTLNADL